MSVTVKFNMSEFQNALKDVASVSRKTMTEQVNQRTMNIAVRALKSTPPKDVPGKRSEIKTYMDFNPVIRLKVTKSGKNKGKFRPVRKRSQLTRANLIVQARRAKQGLKGLYGTNMRVASGKLSHNAQIGAGFLKSLFLPIIRGLYSVVKFRPPASLTRYIARWRGSKGDGKIKVARNGVNPTAVLETMIQVDGGQRGKVGAIQSREMRKAISGETAEMNRHFTKEMQKKINRFQGRRR